MEVNFEGKKLSCLDSRLQEVSGVEQTQEIKLTEGMPDVGQVLCAWGQPILRGKEWRGDSVSVSGGMMVWVLYQAEDGGMQTCIDAWVPFQMKWDLPAGSGEGAIRAQLLTRFVDARSVSPRKILVRCGISAMVTALVRKNQEVSVPQGQEEGVELLKVTYPVRLPQEAGEKTFLMEETLSVPESMPAPQKVLYYRMEAKITDKKVLTGKLVFRGNGLLHVLYAGEDGTPVCWDFEVPFSQYTDLEGEYSSDAQADILLMPTSMELDLEDGAFRFKCGMVAQYLIMDRHLLETVEDAYCPGRELTMNTRILELPVMLENRREMVYGEQTLPVGAASVVDLCFWPDTPKQMRVENGIAMELPGVLQALYYDEEGAMRAGSARWEGSMTLAADDNTSIMAFPGASQVQAAAGSGGIQAKLELPMEVNAWAEQGFNMVTGVELGEKRQLDPGRPSLILRRAGSKGLWDMAKTCGSTMEAIRQANGLQGEPAAGQMLLIPVP